MWPSRMFVWSASTCQRGRKMSRIIRVHPRKRQTKRWSKQEVKSRSRQNLVLQRTSWYNYVRQHDERDVKASRYRLSCHISQTTAWELHLSQCSPTIIARRGTSSPQRDTSLTRQLSPTTSGLRWNNNRRCHSLSLISLEMRLVVVPLQCRGKKTSSRAKQSQTNLHIKNPGKLFLSKIIFPSVQPPFHGMAIRETFPSTFTTVV